DRHAMTQSAGNKLSIIPIFRVELMRKPLDGGFIPTLILILEIVAAGAVFHTIFDYQSFVDKTRQQDTLIIIGQTGKDFIRFAIDKTNECNPFFTIILETYHVCLQYLRTGSWESGFGTFFLGISLLLTFGFIFLFLIISCNKHTTATTVSIHCYAFTAAFPGFHIQLAYKLFGYVVWHIDSHTNAVVYPFLNSPLHAHLSMVVHIIRCSFIVWRLRHQLV